MGLLKGQGGVSRSRMLPYDLASKASLEILIIPSVITAIVFKEKYYKTFHVLKKYPFAIGLLQEGFIRSGMVIASKSGNINDYPNLIHSRCNH